MHLRPTDPAPAPVTCPLACGPLMSASASQVAAPLGRETETLVTCEPVSAVVMASALERARVSLVRGDAGDALAALDEAQDGAMRTESGWYLRSAALTLLGLPEEAERVLQQALVLRGGSVALLFLQSIVRSVVGEMAEARESLLGAEARRPAEPALLAWSAVLRARASGRSGDPCLDPERLAALREARTAVLSVPTAASQAPLRNTSCLPDDLLTPIRDGLSLLQQPSSGAEAHQVAPEHHEHVPAPTPQRGITRAPPSLAESFRSGQRMRVLALVCMALAFAAMVYGLGIAAIALAGGASWLALRSSSVSAAARARAYGTPDESRR